MKKYLGPVPSTSQQSFHLLKSKMLHKVLLLISEADIAVGQTLQMMAAVTTKADRDGMRRLD